MQIQTPTLGVKTVTSTNWC